MGLRGRKYPPFYYLCGRLVRPVSLNSETLEAKNLGNGVHRVSIKYDGLKRM